MHPVELPCPARRDGFRHPYSVSRLDDRLALFLLDGRGHLTGAYHQGKPLDHEQAQQLWQSHSWQPALLNQPWPAMP